jgi:hypothetical protein
MAVGRRVTSSSAPRFLHDCEECVFLVHYAGHDLYRCEQGGWRPTIVARFGDDGPDYVSGPVVQVGGLVLSVHDPHNPSADLVVRLPPAAGQVVDVGHVDVVVKGLPDTEQE